MFFQGGGQGLKRDTRIDAHDFTLAGKKTKMESNEGTFSEQFGPAGTGLCPKQYEYLVLTVSPEDSLPEARRRLVEHSEYGKWELERSVPVSGRRPAFWLRRRVIQVQRTV